ncbi:MAG: aldo/keto reductase [Candidatus Bathyarchaeota archaeon]|nr:MAG: aldo/keto reductase [Candidatus Bathyarchaeota archaeon]
MIVSEISLGTMYHGSYISKNRSQKILRAAIDEGINFIDCADRYGIYDSDLDIEKCTQAEIILGEFLKQNKRDDLVISSKLWFQMRESVNSGGLNRKHIREGIQKSLKHLQTDYLDVYFCHRPDRATPLNETIATMSTLVDEGLIHYWGTSWWPPYLIERTIGIAKELGYHTPSVEEPPYHMFGRFIEVELFDIASHHGMGIAAFEALAGGFLTGKYLQDIPKGSRADVIDSFRESVQSERIKKRNEKIKALKDLAQSIDIPLSHLALAWVLRRPEISSTIMGASKPDQVVSNTAACDVSLDDDTLLRIEEILDNKPTSLFK